MIDERKNGGRKKRKINVVKVLNNDEPFLFNY
jgi:hypothetical protein